MKKSEIKRRKRVIPAAGGSPEGEEAMELDNSPSPGPEARMERGSVNPDGSINLGLRRRQEHTLTLVPEMVLRQNRQTSPVSGSLGQYHSSSTNQPRHIPESLTNENRLAPMAGLDVSDDRQSSLSPASFLSPSRKRSFSAVEDPKGPNDSDNQKRLSSINSILNPTATTPGPGSTPEPLPPMTRSPASTSASAPSPGAFSNAGAARTPPPFANAYSARDPSGDSEKSKAEKRAALARETEKIKELLALKEKELAELEAA